MVKYAKPSSFNTDPLLNDAALTAGTPCMCSSKYFGNYSFGDVPAGGGCTVSVSFNFSMID